MFVLTHWPSIDRFAPRWRPPHADKMVHFALYAGWTVLWWLLLSAGGRSIGKKTINWLVLGGLVYAVFDELTQGIVGREPSLGDLAADILGIVAATAVMQLWQKRRKAT